ncbi:hypothetical protein LCGC14_2334050 [marine sediment metagenome]|uniref:Uncharacterized protein n=1 Tax=marine sediment metagenome TaxID=412755 RepID=A0A0F9D1G0_9ZZZZ
MIIGILHINRKKGHSSNCRICKKAIEVREVHAVVITRYGKGQAAVFKLRAAAGQAMTKKSGLRYSRLHLKDCLALWLISTYTARTMTRRERKGGRPPLPDMTDEDTLTRRRLVRKRAAIIREIVTSEDDARVLVLADRLLEIKAELKIPVTSPHAKNLHRTLILGKTEKRISEAKDGQVRAS